MVRIAGGTSEKATLLAFPTPRPIIGIAVGIPIETLNPLNPSQFNPQPTCLFE
jgi:hypothetical protein